MSVKLWEGYNRSDDKNRERKEPLPGSFSPISIYYFSTAYPSPLPTIPQQPLSKW